MLGHDYMRKHNKLLKCLHHLRAEIMTLKGSINI